MNWKKKALLQRMCARLPVGRETIYYGLQRCGGSLREVPDPWWYLEICVALVTSVQGAGWPSVKGKRVMEVGTGRDVQNPIALFLCGAASIVTYDLHRYLRPSFVTLSIRRLASDRERVARILAPVVDRKTALERIDKLARCQTLEQILSTASIDYRAPADASVSNLPDGSIDMHVSNNVLEHIPPAMLKKILVEAKRVLKPSGLTVHRLGPSDHYSDDPSILPINFLRYSNAEWDRLADNQFAYHNRLRASDYREIYAAAGHQIVDWIPTVHPESVEALKAGFPVNERFQGKNFEDLSTVLLQVVSRPEPSAKEIRNDASQETQMHSA